MKIRVIAIPYEKFTYLIFGYHKTLTDDWINKVSIKWSNYSEEMLQSICSRILLTKSEQWVISQSAYDRMDDKLKNLINISHTPELIKYLDENPPVNLFQQSS